MSWVFSSSSSIVGSVESIVAMVCSSILCLCDVSHVGTFVFIEFSSSVIFNLAWNIASWNFVWAFLVIAVKTDCHIVFLISCR